MLYDTHCHLDLYSKDISIENIVQSAVVNDIKIINTICTELNLFDNILNIAKQFPNVYCSIGQHPNHNYESINENNIEKDNVKKIKINNTYQFILDNVNKNNIYNEKNKIVAIGETGLDFFRKDKDNYSNILHNQKEIFIQHIEASIEANLPLIIHSRDADKETFEILNEYKNKNISGVIHCFTGSHDFMKKSLDLGFHIGFTGIVTFKNNHVKDLLKYMPLDRILLETDSPYLTPEPYRGKYPNESQYLKDIAKFIAILLEIDYNELSDITTKNGMRLFKI